MDKSRLEVGLDRFMLVLCVVGLAAVIWWMTEAVQAGRWGQVVVLAVVAVLEVVCGWSLLPLREGSRLSFGVSTAMRDALSTVTGGLLWPLVCIAIAFTASSALMAVILVGLAVFIIVMRIPLGIVSFKNASMADNLKRLGDLQGR